MFVITIIAAAAALLTTTAIAGTFFGFSVSVMPGLNAIAPDQAVAAMNSVNVKIMNPVFLGPFTGAPLLTIVAGVLLLVTGQRPAGWLFIVAALVYFFGSFVSTIAVNVPLNDALAAVSNPDPDAAARAWNDFSSKWTSWNNLRAVAGLLSVVLIGAGLLAWRRSH